MLRCYERENRNRIKARQKLLNGIPPSYQVSVTDYITTFVTSDNRHYDFYISSPNLPEGHGHKCHTIEDALNKEREIYGNVSPLRVTIKDHFVYPLEESI